MERVIYRNQDGRLIKGVLFNIILRDDFYHLTDLKVYADGYIDCLGSINIDKLKALLDAGKLTLSLPENGQLFIPYVGYIWVAKSSSQNNGYEEFIKVIENTINNLNAEGGEKNECIQRFKEYLLDPSEFNLLQLKKVYYLLPISERAIFEIESKDPLVKLMSAQQVLNREERAYLLRDYFEGEWLEMK